jgi:hypothetical protein
LLASGCRGSLNREGSIGWRTIRALTFPQEQGKLPNPLIGSFSLARTEGAARLTRFGGCFSGFAGWFTNTLP